jgi:hypothetical protein
VSHLDLGGDFLESLLGWGHLLTQLPCNPFM